MERSLSPRHMVDHRLDGLSLLLPNLSRSRMLLTKSTPDSAAVRNTRKREKGIGAVSRGEIEMIGTTPIVLTAGKPVTERVRER